MDAQHELKVDIERIRLSEINGIFARLARDDVAKRSVIDFKAAA